MCGGERRVFVIFSIQKPREKRSLHKATYLMAKAFRQAQDRQKGGGNTIKKP